MITNHLHFFPAMVQKLVDSSFEFHPTGSRFFGGFRPDSDWDFITESSYEVEEFLTLSGFEDISAEEYQGDQLIDKVYRYGNVDVQLSVNLERKLRTQGILKRLYPYGLPGEKECKRLLWKHTDAMLKLLEL